MKEDTRSRAAFQPQDSVSQSLYTGKCRERARTASEGKQRLLKVFCVALIGTEECFILTLNYNLLQKTQLEVSPTLCIATTGD